MTPMKLLRSGSPLLLLALAFLFMTPVAHAKDLTSRLGMGYTDQFSSDLPSIAAKYYPSNDMALGASLGIDTQQSNSKFGFAVKIMRTIFPEDNMNFYMGAGAGLISQQVSGGSNSSGFELSGFVGAEFFLPGLDSLGVSFETGVGVTSISAGTRFRTIGDSPLRAGMFFYF